jgi:hypothetical protein
MLFTIGFQSILNLILHDANSSENFHKNICNTSASFINELFQAAYYLYCSKWVRVNQQTARLPWNHAQATKDVVASHLKVPAGH